MTEFTSEDAGTVSIPPVPTSIERGHEVDRMDAHDVVSEGVTWKAVLGVAHCKARSRDEFPVDDVVSPWVVSVAWEDVMDQTVDEGFEVKEAR